MVRLVSGWWLYAAIAAAAPSDPSTDSGRTQQVLTLPVKTQQGNPRRLQGRFLHITDIHPDPFYQPGSDPSGDHPCHAGNDTQQAGYYGAAGTKCDTPYSLVNATFKWIEENLKDQIDFVVWTGDSARHDNDEDLPRSAKQIEDQNNSIVQKFVETFGKSDNLDDPDPTNDFVIPIVPNIGNNDIVPHNIFEPGPNAWTRYYVETWKQFVPEEQIHSFIRGGWFFSEVIPNKLAVFSLNTLYFFDGNAAVDGCDLKSEPGYEQLEWLRIQLHSLRQRGMKAILMGHVPPARTEGKQNWDESCYEKYTLWQRQFRDVIVGNIYGHMNIDHLMFHDVRTLSYKFKIDGIDDENLRPQIHSRNILPNVRFNNDTADVSKVAKITYLNELRDDWSDLPTPPNGMSYHHLTEDEDIESEKSTGKSRKGKKGEKEKQKFLKSIGGPWGERFSMSIVSPSVVPNFFPTLRIIEYNITGLEHDHPAIGLPQGIPATVDNHIISQDKTTEIDDDEEDAIDDDNLFQISHSDLEIDKKRKKKKKHPKIPPRANFPVPRPPPKTAPPGPAYSPQTLSLLRWTQLYANITEIDEMMNSSSSASQPYPGSDNSFYPSDIHSKPSPPPSDQLFTFKVEYDTHNDHVYRLKDLTVRSWLDLAERMGRSTYKESGLDEGLDVNLQDGMYSDVVSDLGVSNDAGVEGEMMGQVHSAEGSGNKKKQKKKGRRGKLTDNHLWHVFIKRAFVQGKPDSELEEGLN